MTIDLRQATPEDIPHLARLFQMAAGGLMDAVYHDLIPGKSVPEILERRYVPENSGYSYRNCAVALADARVAGGINMRAVGDPRFDWTDPIVPEERKVVLAPFQHIEATEGLYIGFLGVYPQFRRRGIARQLLDFARREAEVRNLASMCLYVFEQNVEAATLYRSLGFEISRRSPAVAHELVLYTGDLTLMTCRL
jgi:ribosomal protein S18 acetylase RimI-like enzyme